MDAGILEQCSAEEQDVALLQFAVAECAVSQSLLELIRAKDRSGSYTRDGAASMAAWLSLKLGWSNHRASRVVKVAAALETLPQVRQAYGQGLICWERTEALCCFATPDTEDELLERALDLGATNLRGLLRSLKPVPEPDARQAYQNRSLRYFWDHRERMLHIKGLLPDVEGSVVAHALDHLAGKRTPEPDEPGEEEASGGPEDRAALVPSSAPDGYGHPAGSPAVLVEPPDQRSFEQTCADALVELCSCYLHTSAEAVRATVVIHAELDALVGARTGIASLQDGPMVCGETVRRMCCDGHCELVVEGPGHQPIGIGRRSRQVPGWLWRVLWHRDQGCRFPGCERQRWIQNHHIEHWTNNGATDKDNLVLLCWHHHHLVHEGGWTLEGDPEGWLDFVSPDGRKITSLPPPALDPDLRNRLFATFSGDPSEEEPPEEDPPGGNPPGERPPDERDSKDGGAPAAGKSKSGAPPDAASTRSAPSSSRYPEGGRSPGSPGRPG